MFGLRAYVPEDRHEYGGGLRVWQWLLALVAAALVLWMIVVSFIVILVHLASAAFAHDDGQWASSPASVRAWFQGLMQPDHPRLSCCGEADAFEADTFEVNGDHYVAVITDGKGILPAGTRIEVPNEKLKYDAGNPTGHGIVFIGSQGQVFCYVVPGGV